MLFRSPFIIKHPKLVHKWMSQYNLAIEKIASTKTLTKNKLNKFVALINKAKDYLNEVKTTDNYQIKKNKEALKDIKKIINFCNKINSNIKKNKWKNILNFAHKNLSYDAQEIIKVQIIELYPGVADNLSNDMSNSDEMYLKVNQKISSLKKFIEKNYNWALKINFNKKENLHLFWYISAEKLEPRLGERFNENGSELEQPLGIGRMVNNLYCFLESHKDILHETVGKFLLS